MPESSDRIAANQRLVHVWIEEAWNQNRNRELVAEVFAEDWKDGNPVLPDQPQGIAGAMHFVEYYRQAFPDIHFTLNHVMADEDYAWFRFTARATHQGEVLGIPATGRQVTITGMVLHRIAGGRFVESWAEYDLLGLMQQLQAD